MILASARLLLPVIAWLAAADAPKFSPVQVAFYEKQVLPILKENCFKCHSGKKVRGGLHLDSRAGLLRGGDLGPALLPDKLDDSPLLKAIHHKDGLEMPPSGKLPAAQLDVLVRWVKMGAPYSPAKEEVVKAPARKEMTITDADRQYWAYRPVKRPAVPAVRDRAWLGNPIDAFLLAKLEAKGLAPAPPAERVALIRRACYDLTGLPPTPEEVDAFVNDARSDAYERLIDRLLASPAYGEKWGRHWLDLVRYAETHGYERDSAKPFAWRYRDYVINAFNSDKPYDRFLTEQLAGDELDEPTPESLIATGYYRLGLWDDEPSDPLQLHYDVLDGIVSTTAQVALGMTVGCARCHDHKKDPIRQRDYYRLAAFFSDITDMNVKNVRRIATPDERRVMESSRKTKVKPTGMEVMCVEERGPVPMHVLIRGNPHVRGDLVTAGFPQVLSTAEVALPAVKKGAGSGKRRALAAWLTSPDNQLAARVMANRLWQYHFGRGIVPTSSDFGKLGEAPTHPELLDWLAVELASDWKLKRTHRLIMLSNAYRMSSKGNAEALAKDPANMLFWRFNMRRLTAEEVRDSMLAAGGTLNRAMAGPSIYPTIPRAVLAGQSMPGNGWGKSPPREQARRSVYVHVKRSLIVPILEVHDLADTDSSCAVRYTTTVPTQALGMLNGDFTNEQAKALAQRLVAAAPDDLAGQVRYAIRLTTGRTPGPAEVRHDVAFVKELCEGGKIDKHAALTLYCLLALNANEFMYLD